MVFVVYFETGETIHFETWSQVTEFFHQMEKEKKTKNLFHVIKGPVHVDFE